MTFLEIEGHLVNIRHIVHVRRRRASLRDAPPVASITLADGKTIHTDLPFADLSNLLQAQPTGDPE